VHTLVIIIIIIIIVVVIIIIIIIVVVVIISIIIIIIILIVITHIISRLKGSFIACVLTSPLVGFMGVNLSCFCLVVARLLVCVCLQMFHTFRQL
jgi:hypothetical protein